MEILDFNGKIVEYKTSYRSSLNLCQIRSVTVYRIVYCISGDYCGAQNCSVFTTWRWIVGNFPNRFSFTTFSSDVRHLKLSTEYERYPRIFCNSSSI